MTVESLIVELNNRSYPIHFSNTFEVLQEDVESLRTACRSICVLSDESVMAAQSKFLELAGFNHEEIFTVPAGEPSKSIEHFNQALNYLAMD